MKALYVSLQIFKSESCDPVYPYANRLKLLMREQKAKNRCLYAQIALGIGVAPKAVPSLLMQVISSPPGIGYIEMALPL